MAGKQQPGKIRNPTVGSSPAPSAVGTSEQDNLSPLHPLEGQDFSRGTSGWEGDAAEGVQNLGAGKNSIKSTEQGKNPFSFPRKSRSPACAGVEINLLIVARC